jgi:protein kinase-like protein
MPNVTRSVGRYEIVRELGRGGMAIVYLARQPDLDRLVALKELSAFHATDPQFARRFLRESRLAGSLSHPNIVTVHDYFEWEGTPYIAMEYVSRGSLRPYVGRLSLAQVVGTIEGILAGLAHAETKGIVHRDLKPENVMVNEEGRVKIADFGIAKAGSGVATGAFLTATGTTVGTPAYMAPEQAMAKEVGPWTDLYSLGVMAYEMLVGRLPFPEDEAPLAILMRQVNEPVPPPRSINPELDDELADWIEQMLVKDPAQRIRNATDAWDELEESVIRIFGARWRREARLPAPAAASDSPRPLTPAPFKGTPSTDPGDESAEFESFAWKKAAARPAESAPPATPPAPAAAPTPRPLADLAPFVAAADAGQAAAPAETAEGAVPSETPEAAAPVQTGEAAAPEARDEAPEPVADPEAVKPSKGAVLPAAAAAAAPSDRDAAEKRFRTFGHRTEAPPRAPAGEDPAEPDEAAPAAEEEWQPTVAPSSVPKAPPMPDLVREERPAAEKPPSRRLNGRVIAILAACVVGALAVGYLVAPSSKKTTPPPALAQSASSGPVQLRFPSAWHESPSGPKVRGLKLSDDIAFTGAPAGAAVLAGMTDASGPTLLPKALRARLGKDPKHDSVRLGSVAAYRYKGLHAASPAQRLTLYAIPTTAGVATLACVGPAASSPDCEAVATTLRLKGVKAFPLGPNARYAKALNTTITTLNAHALDGRRQLAKGRTRAAQAKAATTLARAYRTAASALRSISVSPADRVANDALVTALRKTSAAYAQLATAADHGKKATYAKAQAAVAAGERTVNTTIGAMRELGYAAP